MKDILFALSASIILLYSCTKSSDNSAPSNTFSIGSSTYKAIMVTNSGNEFTANDSSGHSLFFSFYGIGIPDTGSYYLSSNPVFTGSVLVKANNGTTSYRSIDNTGVRVTVTKLGSSTTISLPQVVCKVLFGTDTTLVKGTITYP